MITMKRYINKAYMTVSLHSLLLILLFSSNAPESCNVFFLVGGETLQRSWQVIKPGGTLVSVVSPQPSFTEAKEFDVRPFWFVVEPNRDELFKISELIDEGHIRPVIEGVLPLLEARQAYEQGSRRHKRGKIVLRVVEE